MFVVVKKYVLFLVSFVDDEVGFGVYNVDVNFSDGGYVDVFLVVIFVFNFEVVGVKVCVLEVVVLVWLKGFYVDE